MPAKWLIHYISWILGCGPRWYGKWHSQGIQIAHGLISSLFFRSSNICSKKLYFRQIFLKSIYFPSFLFLHLLWFQTKLCFILATSWLPAYKRFLLQHVFVYYRRCIWWFTHYLILGNKGKCQTFSLNSASFLHCNSTILCYTMMIPSLMLPMTWRGPFW